MLGAPDRVKLPLCFDVQAMYEEVLARALPPYIEYNAVPLTAPAHLVDPSLPVPPPSDNYADGSWTPWLDTAVLTSSPYLTQVVDSFREHTTVTLVRLLRLAPAGRIDEHTDPTLDLEAEASVVRLHIPITTSEQVRFLLNGTEVPMRPGECWYMRLSDPHAVRNDGADERVHHSIDMIPNDWVRALAAGA